MGSGSSEPMEYGGKRRDSQERASRPRVPGGAAGRAIAAAAAGPGPRVFLGSSPTGTALRVDFAIHAPRDFPGSDPRNYHAHLLATTRDITREGLGAKTTLELGDRDRGKLGLKPAIHELLHVRERWATVTNEALHAANIAARVDHRSLEAQGIDREPRPQIPRAAFEMERQGYRSVVAERMREEYALRVKSRMDRRSAGKRPSRRSPLRRRQAAKSRGDSQRSPGKLAADAAKPDAECRSGAREDHRSRT